MRNCWIQRGLKKVKKMFEKFWLKWMKILLFQGLKHRSCRLRLNTKTSVETNKEEKLENSMGIQVLQLCHSI